MESNETNEAKLNKLMEELTRKDILIAFSGGVDSSLLLTLAANAAGKNKTKVYAVTVETSLHPKGDMEIAKRVAKETGAIHKMLYIDELKETGIEDNPKDRCYRCKKGIFTKIIEFAASVGVETVIEGTNEDDLGQYRPGIKALSELGIISPLARCHITKEKVRELSKAHNISVAMRPAAPCLATRFPYGAKLDYNKLEEIDKCEKYLSNMGLYNVRIRVHGDIARIEVDSKDMAKIMENKDDIILVVKNAGFKYVTLDLEGFRSGSMDI